MAGSGRSAPTSVSTIYEKKGKGAAAQNVPDEQASECDAVGRAITMVSLSFSFVQLFGSVSNESLEQLEETKFSSLALFLTWKYQKGFLLCPMGLLAVCFQCHLHGIQQELITQFLHRFHS